MPTPPDAPEPAASLSSKLDRELAAKAFKKAMSGEQPTAAEQAALRRYEKEQEENRRWNYYLTIPQKHWRQMSGRQAKVLREQAERYGIPFDSRVVDLPKVVRAFHDFLAANARKLNADPDELMQGDSSPALERYREERAAIARLDRLEREGSLIGRDEVREGLARIARILRNAGDALKRKYGAGALEILCGAIDDAEQDIGKWLAGVPEADDAET